MPISLKHPCFLALVIVCPLLLSAQDSPSSLFDYDADVRVFTAQALQNASGEDHEWCKALQDYYDVYVR